MSQLLRKKILMMNVQCVNAQYRHFQPYYTYFILLWFHKYSTNIKDAEKGLFATSLDNK